MPLASYQSEQAALSELEAVYSDESRFLDLCLTFRRKRTGEELLRVGGRWDNHQKKYIDPDPADLTAVAILVNENQVAVVRAFARWLNARIADAPRTRLLITGGNRRGGKSWIVTALAAAVVVAIPDAIVWLVSPTLEKREELDRYVKGHIPHAWRRYLARELRYILPTGATIKNVTGDDPEALKRGECDLVVFNEPQLMQSDVLTNGAPAIIDQGGLALFAGNPAQKRKGVWFTRLWKAVESGKYPHGEVYRLDARENPDIDSKARADLGQLLQLVNPDAAKADDEGLFLEPGNYPYAEHFVETRNTVPTFPEIADITTAEVIRMQSGGGGRDVLCGVDFQVHYGNAGVEIVAVGDRRRPTWYVTKCLVREGDESYFLDDAFEMWQRERTLWIGDPSGAWQDAAHIRGRDSFTKFEARKWKIIPPKMKVTDRGKFAAHPPVSDCIKLVNVLLSEGRLIVCMDGAAPVAEALQRCEYGKTGSKTEWRPAGAYAHLTDALRYALYWATPGPKAKREPLNQRDAYSLPIARTPTNLY